MDIKLHKLARTTPATRRYIQTAPKSAATLARELGVALTTIYKWKHAGRVHDGSHVRHQLHASTSPEQEALIAELRTQFALIPRRCHGGHESVQCAALESERDPSLLGAAGRGAVASRLPRRAAGGAVRGNALRVHSSGSESVKQITEAAQLCVGGH